MMSVRVKMAMVMVVAWVLGVTWSPAQSRAQCCGDCDGDGHVTVDELVTSVNRALNGCQDDGVCGHSGARRFPATGQLTPYGPGSDGDVRAGAALSYTDNGDGTITDNNTGLMWEKKDDSGGIHGKDNYYYWWDNPTPGYLMDGTIVTEFLATLNKTSRCFANHCDWRIPNVKELQSIVDYEVPLPGRPTVNAAFHNAVECPGCTEVTLASCSCTASDGYWSSTASPNRNDQGPPPFSWLVHFGNGGVDDSRRSNGWKVRAVRGGL